VRQTIDRGAVFVAPIAPVRIAPVVVFRSIPFSQHRHRVFHRFPSIVIVDAPYFSQTTVITEVAPGVLSEDRRYSEKAPSDLPTRAPGQLAPFDPTPQEVVERMLTLAGVKSGDVLYDLGAGDGRIVITAAKKYGIKAVGFEIDPGLAKLARENTRKQGMEKLVEIRQQDFLAADLSRASVVTLYLSYDGNLAVRPKLIKELKPGARVVSYTFDMGDWQPKIIESYRDASGNIEMMYLWGMGGVQTFSDSR
jgi:precorrin-6B methylase 2